MIIESKRIILRSWKNSDIDALVEGLNNINISKWLSGVPHPYTEKDAKSFLAYSEQHGNNSQNIFLAVVVKESDKVIGGTSIENINQKDGTAGGGIWLNEAYHGHGYGTEAFCARNKYAFEVLGLRRIENGYFVGNTASENMQKKLGYKVEGLRRQKYCCLATGEYVDEIITGLLKEEFVDFVHSKKEAI